jgi:hypothetical protein
MADCLLPSRKRRPGRRDGKPSAVSQLPPKVAQPFEDGADRHPDGLRDFLQRRPRVAHREKTTVLSRHGRQPPLHVESGDELPGGVGRQALGERKCDLVDAFGWELTFVVEKAVQPEHLGPAVAVVGWVKGVPPRLAVVFHKATTQIGRTLATGSGKTLTSLSSAYRLWKFGGASESSSSWTAMFVISARTCQEGLSVRTQPTRSYTD